MKNAALIILALSLSTLLLYPANAKNIWTPEKSTEIKTISNLSLSPDLEWIVYCVTEIVKTKLPWTYLTHVWLSRTNGSLDFQLTRGEKSCTSPSWSPDGKAIAFLSARNGKSNIWLISTKGGEARPLTEVETGVVAYKWSPDGQRIAFTMVDPPPKELMELQEQNIGAPVCHRCQT
jgi:dipeptidyl aminopeptidase/acylaminoacyl peptidase